MGLQLQVGEPVTQPRPLLLAAAGEQPRGPGPHLPSGWLPSLLVTLLLTLRSRQLSPIVTWRHPPFIWELAGGFQQIVNFIKLDRDVSGGYLGPKPGGWTLHFVQGGPRLDLVLLDDDCHRTFGGAFSPPSALHQRLV